MEPSTLETVTVGVAPVLNFQLCGAGEAANTNNIIAAFIDSSLGNATNTALSRFDCQRYIDGVPARKMRAPSIRPGSSVPNDASIGGRSLRSPESAAGRRTRNTAFHRCRAR